MLIEIDQCTWYDTSCPPSEASINALKETLEKVRFVERNLSEYIEKLEKEEENNN